MPAVPQRLWQAAFPESPDQISMPNAECIGAWTTSRIYVLDGNGQTDWETTLPSNWHRGAFALSPTCDWFAISTRFDTAATMLVQIIGRDGTRKTISVVGATGAPHGQVGSLDVSPDGKLLAIGFEESFLWIASKDGNVLRRIGPLDSSYGVGATFAADGRRLVLTRWFNTGVMNLDGTWVWKARHRNLIASPSLDLFAGLWAPMHGPQGGSIGIFDSNGKELWSDGAWNADMAVDPHGRFVVFSGSTESASQPTPFPIVPILNAPEIWIRDRSGQLMAQGPFKRRLAGVSSGSCILAMEVVESQGEQSYRLIGLDRWLTDVWHLDNATDRYPTTFARGDLLLQKAGNTIQAFQLPHCSF